MLTFITLEIMLNLLLSTPCLASDNAIEVTPSLSSSRIPTGELNQLYLAVYNSTKFTVKIDSVAILSQAVKIQRNDKVPISLLPSSKEVVTVFIYGVKDSRLDDVMLQMYLTVDGTKTSQLVKMPSIEVFHEPIVSVSRLMESLMIMIFGWVIGWAPYYAGKRENMISRLNNLQAKLVGEIESNIKIVSYATSSLETKAWQEFCNSNDYFALNKYELQDIAILNRYYQIIKNYNDDGKLRTNGSNREKVKELSSVIVDFLTAMTIHRPLTKMFSENKYQKEAITLLCELEIGCTKVIGGQSHTGSC